MNQPFNEFSKISEIVTEFPNESDQLKTYRIDFCCGGNWPLIEAIKEKNLSKDEILSKLNTLYQEKKLSNEVEIDFK